MQEHQLFFVLSDDTNEHVLLMNQAGTLRLPVYDKAVGENAGFDDPTAYNEFFSRMIGAFVYRRYSFTHRNIVAFVYEHAGCGKLVVSDGFHWVSYKELSKYAMEAPAAGILLGVRRNYHKSINMPWANHAGFRPYFEWMRRTCALNHIRITAEIAQIKNAYVSTVFRIPTSIGDLYMKIPGAIYIDEMAALQRLKRAGIIRLPEVLDQDPERNVILMRDMKGSDLSEKLDLEAGRALFHAYAEIQKKSISYAAALPAGCKDHRVHSLIGKLDGFSDRVCQRMRGTKHETTPSQERKLRKNAAIAADLLKQVSNGGIPATVQHGDLRSGNIKVVNGEYIFYDWSWSAVAHPFIDISLLLHTMRNALPAGICARETLIESYLGEWSMYGTGESLRREFEIIDALKELFMAFYDFCWLEAIWDVCGEDIDPLSADGWLLARRLHYFSVVLSRFAERDINANALTDGR